MHRSFNCFVHHTNLGIVAIRESLNEGMGIGGFCSLTNLLHGCTVFSIKDVFKDTSSKQGWLLIHQSNLLSQPLQLKALDIEPIKEYLTCNTKSAVMDEMVSSSSSADSE